MKLTIENINWFGLGRKLREAALDAHDGKLVSITIAYSFLLDNPDLFLLDLDPNAEWPENMPPRPPKRLRQAYYLG